MSLKYQGAAFSSHIRTENLSKRKKDNNPEFRQLSFRSFFLPFLLCLFFGILLIKLLGLQIFQGSEYRNLSNINRMRTTVVHAPRGVIFDRNGNALVYNVPGFRKNVNGKTELVSQSEAISDLASGKQLEVDSLREYPYKDVFADTVGYVGQISPEELSLPGFANYQSDSIVGKMGIEEQYEKDLAGSDGKTLDEINANGKIVRILGKTDPVPGKNLTLTVDTKLQQAAYDATKNVKKGAVVVSKPDGEVLALISRPTFDPNLFTMGNDYKVSTDSAYQSVEQVVSDSNGQPLLDRAIAGVYPPGSTFKIVTAAAGLEDKVINADFTINDTGTITLGSFTFSNWFWTDNHKTDGLVNLVKAIQRSNDIFFYKLGSLLGVDKLSAFAKKFNLGSQLGIDLPGEAPGLVPTKQWKQSTIGEPWYEGDDYHYGIGQGYLLTTPLQVNAWTQAIANGGTLYQPHLLLSTKPKVLQKKILSPQNFDLIRQGMIAACNPGGVAWPLFNYTVKNSNLKIDGKNITAVNDNSSTNKNSISSGLRHVVIACKTGTAQQGDADADPHAWLTLFAPAYNPQIVITVLSESSGEGSNIAGPIAKQILDAYFSK